MLKKIGLIIVFFFVLLLNRNVNATLDYNNDLKLDNKEYIKTIDKIVGNLSHDNIMYYSDKINKILLKLNKKGFSEKIKFKLSILKYLSYKIDQKAILYKISNILPETLLKTEGIHQLKGNLYINYKNGKKNNSYNFSDFILLMKKQTLYTSMEGKAYFNGEFREIALKNMFINNNNYSLLNNYTENNNYSLTTKSDFLLNFFKLKNKRDFNDNSYFLEFNTGIEEIDKLNKTVIIKYIDGEDNKEIIIDDEENDYYINIKFGGNGGINIYGSISGKRFIQIEIDKYNSISDFYIYYQNDKHKDYYINIDLFGRDKYIIKTPFIKSKGTLELKNNNLKIASITDLIDSGKNFEVNSKLEISKENFSIEEPSIFEKIEKNIFEYYQKMVR